MSCTTPAPLTLNELFTLSRYVQVLEDVRCHPELFRCSPSLSNDIIDHASEAEDAIMKALSRGVYALAEKTEAEARAMLHVVQPEARRA